MTEVELILPHDNENRLGTNSDLPTAKRGLAWMFFLLSLFFISAVAYAAIYGVHLAITQPGLVQSGDKEVLGSMVTDHLISYSDSMLGLSLVHLLFLLPALMLISNFKHQSFKITLALRGFDRSVLIKAIILFGIYLVMAILVDEFLVDGVDDFILQINGTHSLGVAFSIVILAPIYEELLFRGYFFKVLRSTRLGSSGTILITSVLFLALHLGQYQWPIMVSLFMFSCLLGYLREKSGSVFLPMLFHGLNNLVSAVLIVYLGLA